MGIRAIRFHETGSAEILQWEEIDVPPPGPGEVRLKNKAIGINMKEIGERQGAYPGPPLPAIPGIEAAAQVVTVGDGVTDFRSGDRVAMEKLLAVCQPDIRRYAMQHCMISDVDDAVQEVLLIIARKISAFKGNFFTTWEELTS